MTELSAWTTRPGVDHLGIQVEEEAELVEIRARLRSAGDDLVEEVGAICCYARSDKYWVTDPAGVAWESYRTLAEAPLFNARDAGAGDVATACCAPVAGAASTPSAVVNCCTADD